MRSFPQLTRRLPSALALAILLLPAFVGHAQDVSPADLPPADSTRAEDATTDKPSVENLPADAAPADSDAAAKAAFLAVESKWREILKRLAAIKIQFEAGDPAQRDKLREQFQQLAQESRELEPALIEAAESFYPFAGDRQAELGRLLNLALRQKVARDDHEAALQLAETLLAGKSNANDLELLAGVAAFGCNHFDKANEYLETAAKKGQIDSFRKQEGDVVEQIGHLVDVALLGREMFPKLWEDELKIRAAEAKADDLPRVKLETTKGEIVLELFENEAPIATANFINLIESGYYDGLKFHRVLGGFMAQGGCPQGTGSGGPGYHIPCECHQDDFRHHFRGTISMAHAGRDTGGSQFFLTFVPTPHLDGRQTAFGRIIEGFDVLAKLRRTKEGSQVAVDSIEKATVLRKRDHDYKPTKV